MPPDRAECGLEPGDIRSRAHRFNRVVVLGGSSVSACPEHYPEFDYLHVGEMGDALIYALLLRHLVQLRPATGIAPQELEETLAQMVGTTRARINTFMNKFRRLGFIDYDGKLEMQIHSSLLNIILHD